MLSVCAHAIITHLNEDITLAVQMIKNKILVADEKKLDFVVH